MQPSANLFAPAAFFAVFEFFFAFDHVQLALRLVDLVRLHEFFSAFIGDADVVTFQSRHGAVDQVLDAHHLAPAHLLDAGLQRENYGRLNRFVVR